MYEVLCVDLEGGKGIFLSLGSIQVICKDKESKAVGIKPRNKFFIDRVFKVQVLDSGVCGKLPYTTFRGKSRGLGA